MAPPTRFRCANCIKGKARCMYATLDIKEVNGIVSTNVPEEGFCLLGKSDEYAIDVKIQRGADGLMRWHEAEMIIQDPFAVNTGNVYNWESLTSHNTTGDAYQLNRHDHIPPLYHEKYFMCPTARGIGIDDTCDIIGENEFALVLNRWHEDGYGEPVKLLGIPRVNRCRGLYGVPDIKSGISLHKSMKSWWKQIPWWNNYTIKKPYGVKCPLNAHISPWESIEEWVCGFINIPLIQARLLEAYQALKCNKYVPIGIILKANGLNDEEINVIQEAIATKNPRDIYTSSGGTRYNVYEIKRLYFNLKRNIFPINAGTKFMYMANIVNYLLNDTKGIGSVQPANVNYNPSDRYWHAIDVVSSALYEDRLIKSVDKLPGWFMELVQKNAKLKEEIVYSDEYDRNPPVMSIREILEIKPDDEVIYKPFGKVLKAMERISIRELESVWKHWRTAMKKENPELFWDYIRSIIDGHDFDDVCTLKTMELQYNWALKVWDACVDYNTFDVEYHGGEISPYWDIQNRYVPEPTYEDTEDWTGELLS